MKKVLLLLSLLLASTAFSNAQSLVPERSIPGDGSLRSGIELPAGFTYANRAAAKAGKFQFFGPSFENLIIAAAMELPAADGVTIKGLHFDARAGVKEGQIFVASRAKDTLSDKYTLESVEAVALKSGMNSFTYKKPVVTKPEKVYIIGYSCTATKGDNALLNPTVFILDKNSWREASLQAWVNKEGLHSPIGKVGEKVPFMQFDSYDSGNIAIVAQLDDSKKNMDRMAVFFTGAELPLLDYSGASIPASATKMKFQIHNIGLKPIKEVLLEVKRSDGSAPVTKVLKLDLKPQDFKIIPYDELGEITKKGAGAVTFFLKEVDGQANGCNDFNRTKRVLKYKLLDETQAVLRNELLIEHFTEEDCGACPYATRRIDTAILELQKEGKDIKPIMVAHHCGLSAEGDFLTVPGSLDLIPYFQAPLGVSFAPAMSLNRNGKKEMIALQDEPMIYMVIGSASEVKPLIEIALSQRSEAYIDRISQKPNADSTRTAITITGKDLSGGTVKDDLFVSVYRIENGISPQNQSGLSEEQKKTYKHDHVIREFVTPTFGAKPEWNGNDFILTLKDVKLDPDWDADKMSFVVFIHRDIRSKALANRYVYSSVAFGLKQATSTREVSEALRPTAYSRDGRIFLAGSFDSFEVYDLGGRSVAKDSETVLPSGVYVVKARLGDVDYTSKTLVP